MRALEGKTIGIYPSGHKKELSQDYFTDNWEKITNEDYHGTKFIEIGLNCFTPTTD